VSAPAAEPAPRATPRWRRLSVYAVVLVVTFALYPFVAFLNRNRDEIADVGQLITYALVIVAASLAVVVAVALLSSRTAGERAAVGVAVFLLSFFGFHVLFSEDPLGRLRVPQLIAWLVLTGLLVALAVRLARYPSARTFLLVLGLALTVLPLGEYLVWRATEEPAKAAAAIEVEVDPDDVAETPNVYLFVLDEYARNDQLQAVLGYDNTAFYEELRDRGFVVEEDVHAPFQQTIMSMASVFDMEYIATTPDEAAGGSHAVANRLRGENATVAYFRALGYEYAYSPPGLYTWNQCEQDLVDLCIEPDGKGLYLTELDKSLLDLTPIGSLDLVREAVTDPDYAVEQLYEQANAIEEPFFLYSHVVSPHWPYRFTEDCELRSRFVYPPLLLDKSDADRADYLQDLECLNQRVLDGIERIVAEDPDAIVVLMSDHGSKFIPDGNKRLEDWRPEAVREEFGILYALRVPERCQASVEETTNSVETFRVVGACLEDRPVERLDDRAFLWPHSGPGPQEVDDVEALDPVP
jgi:hypothetical protein